ncbi:WD40 repeat-like protein [Penicillium herquei]|nr:WD40 repeat-like protein [Penicillium herquei]
MGTKKHHWHYGHSLIPGFLRPNRDKHAKQGIQNATQAVDPQSSTNFNELTSVVSEITPDTLVEKPRLPTQPESLWDEAYESLKKDQPDLLQAYENILARELDGGVERPSSFVNQHTGNAIEQDDFDARRSQMKQIVQRGLQKTEKEAKLKKTMGQPMQIALAANDIISFALNSCSEAALAWSGISLALQILTNPVTETEANRKGIEYVIKNMRWYWELSCRFLKENSQEDESYVGLRWELKEQIVDLFKVLLAYQIKSAYSFYLNRYLNLFRDMFQIDDWDGSFTDVKDAEIAVRRKYKDYYQQISLGHQGEDTWLLQGISKSLQAQVLQQREIQEEKDDKICLKDLYLTDPSADMQRIQESRDFLLTQACEWVFKDPNFVSWRNEEARLLWIKGAPGKGKTMLLISIIEELSRSPEDAHILSFFFCQETDTSLNHAAGVLRGLIHQILVQNRALISYLRDAYDTAGSKLFEGSNTFSSLRTVFLKMMKDDRLDRMYLVVDALDECQAELGQLLDLIVQSVSESSRVKWLVSSRHKDEIEKHLQRSRHSRDIHLEKNVEDLIHHGVNVFIDRKMEDLVAQYDASYKHRGPAVLKELEKVENELAEEVRRKSDGTFLWVALVFKEIKKNQCDAQNFLDFVRRMPPTLDKMYEQMMEQILNLQDGNSKYCQQALLIAVNAYRPLRLSELEILADLPVLSDPRKIILLCGVFSIRESDETVSFVHQSAKDYLQDANSKSSLQIFPDGHSEGHRKIAMQSLYAMSDVLRRDIYGVGRPDAQPEDYRTLLPGPLRSIQYSSIYWIDHFCQWQSSHTHVNAIDIAIGQIDVFWKKHFLHWLEALSIYQKLSDILDPMRRLINLMDSVSPESHLSKLIRDSNRFILQNRQTMENYPLQIYVSALLFSPEKSLVRVHFKVEEPKWIMTKPVMDENWGACIQTLVGHVAHVLSTSFSPNSEILASSSSDHTIKIWNTKNGACIQTLEGHTDYVNSISFSPNGTYIASGSEDYTVKIWDATDGACIQTLEGHTDYVRSISYSPSGTYIASGSDDHTVKIWDATDGACIQTLEGHTDYVRSISYSPNGTYIASGSQDRTVKIWETSTSSVATSIIQRHGGMTSVAVSPTGTHIASGSSQGTIMLWDSSSLSCIRKLQRDDYHIHFVSFSPSGKYILSQHDDWTISMWDANTGTCLRTSSCPPGNTGSFNQLSHNMHTYIGGYFEEEAAILTRIGSEPPGEDDYGVSDDGTWITWKGEGIISLPLGYRPIEWAADPKHVWISDSREVWIACDSDRILFFKFSDQPPLALNSGSC